MSQIENHIGVRCSVCEHELLCGLRRAGPAGGTWKAREEQLDRFLRHGEGCPHFAQVDPHYGPRPVPTNPNTRR